MIAYAEKTRTAEQSTPLAEGLSKEEVLKSRSRHGSNVLPTVKRKRFISRFWENLGDPVIRILLIALVLNLLFLIFGIGSGDVFEPIGIAVSVLLATTISTLSEYTSDAAFRKLSGEAESASVRVRRDGAIEEIALSEIVCGDVVLLTSGEQIPADGIILSGRIGCNQSALTGESKEAEKYPGVHAYASEIGETDPSCHRSLFRGCTVLNGECEMRVTRIGADTVLGEISREVQEETRVSPLKLRLGKLAGQISIFGYVAAGLIAFAYLFVTFFVECEFQTDILKLKLMDLPFVIDSLLHALTLGLTVIVVAVPEGLPLMVAVVLSSNMKRMINDRVLVRKPVGIESAGSMNLLFTDKTGTLTEGQLSVGSILLGNGTSFASVSKFRKTDLYREYLRSAELNTSSVIGKSNTGKHSALGGNGTDRALLLSVIRDAVGTHLKERTEFLPFDSTRKYSAAVTSGTTYLKGAPERLLPFVSQISLPDGSTVPFSAYRNRLLKELDARTSEGSRLLLIARAEKSLSRSELESGCFCPLTLICAVELRDRIRTEAPRAVADLRNAGIHVVMVTGDNRGTATAIAERCGILQNGVDTVLTGEELARLSDARVKELLPRLGVIARALPTDKSRLVMLAQEMGLVVGMTGDGINDAPALKKADVGFSMGSGTQVAKDAGDIVILDNNLASIVRAVLYGRTIFRSIRKFITLQLTMNFSAVGVTMIAPFLGIESPVTVVQMLWINLIMDTLGGLAFAGEAPMQFYMKEPPKRRDEPILNRYMIHQIAILGGFTVLISLLFLFSPYISSHFRNTEESLCLLTAFFAFFIFTSVANCFNCRSDRLNLLAGIGKNPAFLLVMMFVLSVQILFVYLGGAVLRTIPLQIEELLFTLLLSLLVFPAELLRKLLWRCSGHHNGF